MEEHLTVGHVAELAGVTVRTLHHYDEMGLVVPSARTAAGYRAYSARDVERLREVLGYRRLGFKLCEIADLVDDPATDAVAHLHRLRGLLLEQRDRADAMVTAIDRELTARAKGMAVTPEEQLGMLGARLYDAIGSAYPATRRTDPRLLRDLSRIRPRRSPGRRRGRGRNEAKRLAVHATGLVVASELWTAQSVPHDGRAGAGPGRLRRSPSVRSGDGARTNVDPGVVGR